MLYIELIIFFTLGYLAIIFESFIRFNKAATALVMGVVCWALYFLYTPENAISKSHIAEQIYDVAQVIFFLLSAMIIVELIDSHHGFRLITEFLQISAKRKLLWFLLLISFFLSSVLDNLTTMIVMVSLLKKMIPEKNDRWLFGSLIVIAVNAGGAWTPIGDVTTTMLWINDKITTWAIMKSLFLPSVICLLVSGVLGMFMIKNADEPVHIPSIAPLEPGGASVFFMGVGSLILIPVWKAVVGIPPFMGALIGLGLLWLITDLIHVKHGEKRSHLRVSHAITRIDMTGILFFLGILLAIDALASAGILQVLADELAHILPNQNWVAVAIGLISSVIDNVPLVAATMGMYDPAAYPRDSQLWQLIAYAAGTGGSILVIGSAAGVAFMGMEKVDFIWYFKKVSWIALLGYFAGIFTYFLLFS